MALDSVSGINVNQSNTADAANGFDVAVSDARVENQPQAAVVDPAANAAPVSKAEVVDANFSSSAYLAVGFAPVGIITDKVIQRLGGALAKSDRAGISGKSSSAAAEAAVKANTDKINPFIQKLLDAGINVSKLLKVEFNLDVPVNVSDLVMHVKFAADEIRQLPAVQLSAFVTAVAGLSGIARQSAVDSAIATVLTGVTTFGLINDVRVSFSKGGLDGVRFGLMSLKSLDLVNVTRKGIKQDSPLSFVPFFSPRIWLDGTRQIVFGLEYDISAPKGTGSIFVGGGGYGSIKFKEQDLVTFPDGRIGLKTTRMDNLYNVVIPTEYYGVLQIDPARISAPASKDFQEISLNDFSVPLIQNVADYDLGPVSGLIEKIEPFIDVVNAVIDPLQFLQSAILGRDPTTEPRKPGVVTDNGETSEEAMRVLIGKLLRGDQEDIDRVIQAYVDRFKSDRAEAGRLPPSEPMLAEFRTYMRQGLEALDPEAWYKTASYEVNGKELIYAPAPGTPGAGDSESRKLVWVPTLGAGKDGAWLWVLPATGGTTYQPADRKSGWIPTGIAMTYASDSTAGEQRGYVSIWSNPESGEIRYIGGYVLPPEGKPIYTGPDGLPIDCSGRFGYIRTFTAEGYEPGSAIFCDGRGYYFIVENYGGTDADGYVYMVFNSGMSNETRVRTSYRDPDR
jgi:hypothetical protein